MAGYVSMDDILKGVTSAPETSKSNDGSGYVSMDSILSGQNNTAPVQAPTISNNDAEKQYADAMKAAYTANPSVFTDKTPTPDTTTQADSSGSSFLDKLGQALSPSKALEAAQKIITGTPLVNLDTSGSTDPVYADDPSRQLPIIGPILRGIDTLGQDPLVQKIGELGREFYVPGASMENVASLAGSAENAVSRLFPGLGGSAAGNIAQRAATEALVGAPLGAGQTLQTNPDASLGDVATGAAQGALLGGVLGGGIPALSSLGDRAMGGLAGFPVRGEAPIPETSALPAESNSGYKSMDEILNGNKESATPDNSNFPLTNSMEPKDTALNIDSALPEPIQLSPKEIARQDRIDQFSKVEDNPVIPDTSAQIQSKTVAERTPLSQLANEAYIKGVDNLHRINQFDQTVAKVTGGDLKPSNSSYKLGLNSRGSDMISRQILEKNLVDSQGNVIHLTDSEGNVIGSSLKSVADMIPKGKQKSFEDYLIAKHAVTRMGRGEKVYKDSMNMTVQKAQMKADQLEQANPGFKKAAEAYYNYNQKLGQAWLVDTGLISQKQWDGYLAANPNYVPNQRIFSKLEQTQQYGSKGGFANQTAPVKKAEGSHRPIVSPMESTIENTAKYVKTAKQNEVMQVLYDNIQKNPEAFKDWAEIANEPRSDVNQILHEEGPEGLLDEVSKSFESAKQKPDLTKGNIVSAFINGERVHLRINDPQLLEALTNLSPSAQPKWVEAIGKVTKVMKTLTTGLNPVFSLTRNIARDLPHAYVSSKSTNNPLLFGKDILGAFVDVLGKREAYNSYKNIGGGHSSPVASDRNLLAQSKEKILPSKGLRQTLKQSLITKPYHALENLNNAIETAPRLAEFKRLAKSGTYDSKVNALYQANDLTTNFNKYGTNVKQLDSLVPYLNASVQGLDQLARMFKSNPVGATTKAVAAITIPTVILYAANHNDPNYQQVSNFVKDNNFLIPKGDGTFIKIPKPRELGMVFSSGIERAMSAWNGQDPEAFKDFATNLLQNFMPPNPVTSNILSPIVTNLPSNKDFAGRPIVPGDLAKLSPALQYDDRTSEPAKLIGRLTNTSPKQLDYLTKSYGGIIGQLGVPLTTKGSSLVDTLKQQVTSDPAYSNDISKNFYDAKTKADTAKADQKATGDPTDDAAYQKYYDKINTHIAKLRKYMKAIQSDDSLSKSDKNAQLRDLQQQLNEFEQQATLK